MPLKNLNDVLHHELTDLMSAERQLTKALPKMAKNSNSPELAEAFLSHLKETEVHIQRLEQAFTAIGDKPGRHKCAGMEGLIAEGEELIEKADKSDPDAFDAALISAAQRVEHYQIAAYGSAVEFAKNLGFTEAASLLQQTLDEEGAADKKLTALATSGINRMAKAGNESGSSSTGRTQSAGAASGSASSGGTSRSASAGGSSSSKSSGSKSAGKSSGSSRSK